MLLRQNNNYSKSLYACFFLCSLQHILAPLTIIFCTSFLQIMGFTLQTLKYAYRGYSLCFCDIVFIILKMKMASSILPFLFIH